MKKSNAQEGYVKVMVVYISDVKNMLSDAKCSFKHSCSTQQS